MNKHHLSEYIYEKPLRSTVQIQVGIYVGGLSLISCYYVRPLLLFKNGSWSFATMQLCMQLLESLFIFFAYTN